MGGNTARRHRPTRGPGANRKGHQCAFTCWRQASWKHLFDASKPWAQRENARECEPMLYPLAHHTRNIWHTPVMLTASTARTTTGHRVPPASGQKVTSKWLKIDQRFCSDFMQSYNFQGFRVIFLQLFSQSFQTLTKNLRKSKKKSCNPQIIP